MTGPCLSLSRRSVLGGLTAGAVALPGAGWSAEGASPVAVTRHGPVRGYLDKGIKVFKGLRYGADTAGRRFLPPLPPRPWTEAAEATAYGPASPQRGREGLTSEDCLFLNVWTPALDAGRRPVMVYIHGGAYSTGSGSSPLYDGVNLCRRAR